MNECSTEGVYYYRGAIATDGAYADMSNGKEPSCIGGASMVVAVLFLLVMLGALL